MHVSKAALADRHSLGWAARRAAIVLASLVIVSSAAALAGCGGSGSGTSPSTSPPASSSPLATLSQSDTATLTFMAETVTRLDANAAAAADFLTSLETGKWLRLTEQEQLAVLSNLESLSQTLARTIAEGYPKAQATDLKAAEKGPFTAAAKACSDYISAAADAASNLLYLPAARVKADTPHWVKFIGGKGDRYAAAREPLQTAMAALQARYGS
jgi:hypothetical protein